ncbi:MAG: hypothetical protein ACLSB9_32270 [Hydrogeniiclostridium mannosilyticum]
MTQDIHAQYWNGETNIYYEPRLRDARHVGWYSFALDSGTMPALRSKNMMMKEKVGEVFSIAMDNPRFPAARFKAVHDGATTSFAFPWPNTDISAVYPYHKLIIRRKAS